SLDEGGKKLCVSALNLMTLPLGEASLAAVPSYSPLPYHKIPRRWGNVARNALSWHEMPKIRNGRIPASEIRPFSSYFVSSQQREQRSKIGKCILHLESPYQF
ncbi:MAG: hypothetical protein ACI4OD_08950, partial [Selenomonas sp.]